MKLKLMLVVFAMIAMPLMAFANHLVTLDIEGDCSTWSATASIHWANQYAFGTMDYDVSLEEMSGSDWVVVQTISATGMAITPLDPFAWEQVFEFGSAWNADVNGTYRVNGTMTFTGNDGTVSTMSDMSEEFDCITQSDVCHHTPGYWKNHPQAWPEGFTMTFGDETLGYRGLMTILNTPVRGDATIILGYHLIAAQLNVAVGTDPSISGTIDEALAYFQDVEIGSRPRDKEYPLMLKDILADYNEMGCDGLGSDEDDMDKAGSAAEEGLSFDGLKALYR